MNKPHIHAELIKAWADGAEIEKAEWSSGPMGVICCDWSTDYNPTWNPITKYRIKPTPKPDVVVCGKVFYAWGKRSPQNNIAWEINGDDNLALTFDGETGKLKSAEVLK